MLFIAGATSSVSLLQPAVAFVDDEFRLGRTKSVFIIAAFCFLACHAVIFGLAHGVLDDLDFWSNTFSLVLLGTIEAIIFGWVFGIDRAWKEIHRGADVALPVIFKVVIKYITPTVLLVILGAWTYTRFIPVVMMEEVAPENIPWVLGTRIGLLVLVVALIGLVYRAWRGRPLPDIDIDDDEVRS